MSFQLRSFSKELNIEWTASDRFFVRRWIQSLLERQPAGTAAFIQKEANRIFAAYEKDHIPLITRKLKEIGHTFKPYQMIFTISQVLGSFLTEQVRELQLQSSFRDEIEQKIRALQEKIAIEGFHDSQELEGSQTKSQATLREIQSYVEGKMRELGRTESDASKIWDAWYEILRYPICLDISLATFLGYTRLVSCSEVVVTDAGKEKYYKSVVEISLLHLQEGYNRIHRSLHGDLIWTVQSIDEKISRIDGLPCHRLNTLQKVKNAAEEIRHKILPVVAQSIDASKITDIADFEPLLKKLYIRCCELFVNINTPLGNHDALLMALEKKERQMVQLLADKKEETSKKFDMGYILFKDGPVLVGEVTLEELRKIIAYIRVIQNLHIVLDNHIGFKIKEMWQTAYLIQKWQSKYVPTLSKIMQKFEYEKEFLNRTRKGFSEEELALDSLKSANTGSSNLSGNQSPKLKRVSKFNPKKGPTAETSSSTSLESTSLLSTSMEVKKRASSPNKSSLDSNATTLKSDSKEVDIEQKSLYLKALLREMGNVVSTNKQRPSKAALRQAEMHLHDLLLTYRLINHKNPSQLVSALFCRSAYYFMEQLMRSECLQNPSADQKPFHNLNGYALQAGIQSDLIQKYYLANYWTEFLYQEYEDWRQLAGSTTKMPSLLCDLHHIAEGQISLKLNLTEDFEKMIHFFFKMFQGRVSHEYNEKNVEMLKRTPQISSQIHEHLAKLTANMESRIASTRSTVLSAYFKQAVWSAKLLKELMTQLQSGCFVEDLSYYVRETFFWQHTLLQNLINIKRYKALGMESSDHDLSLLFEESLILERQTADQEFINFLKEHFSGVRNNARYPYQPAQAVCETHKLILAAETLRTHPELADGFILIPKATDDILDFDDQAVNFDEILKRVVSTLEKSLNWADWLFNR